MPTVPPTEIGLRGRKRFFGLGSTSPTDAGLRHEGGYAALGLATTGFTPMKDRIVELALVLLDPESNPQDEWTTLLDPGPRGTGLVTVHGLDAGTLEFSPTFAEVAREFLGLLEGRVVVAHNAELAEQFLAAELLAAGRLAPTVPALDVFRLGHLTFDTRNHRLATLASHAGLPGRAGETAMADARIIAGLLPRILERHGATLTYPVSPTPATAVPPPAPRRTRPFPMHRTGPAPWLAELVARLPMSAQEANDPRVLAYLEALTSIVIDNRIVTAEARELTGRLVESGYPAEDIRRIHERLLESLREAAFAERTLTRAQLAHLRAVATSLAAPTYFDDLIPPPQPEAPRPGSGSFARPVRKPLPPAPPPRVPRCGHCLGTGHYTAACPTLRRRREVGPVGPVRAVRPIEPI